VKPLFSTGTMKKSKNIFKTRTGMVVYLGSNIPDPKDLIPRDYGYGRSKERPIMRIKK